MRTQTRVRKWKQILTVLLLGIVFVMCSSQEAKAARTLEFGDYQYVINDDLKTVSIEGYIGNGPSATIPETINGRKVTKINDYAFGRCQKITSVTIPNSVTEIEDEAFYTCENLTTVKMGTGVTRIGTKAFCSCKSLTDITLPDSVTSIGQLAFEECSSLKSITIPNGVTILWRGAFANCSSLTSITIPNGVKEIDDYVFEDCSSLTGITIPNSVKEIGTCAFKGCSSLKSIAIPNGVTDISVSAFEGCSSLESVTIPGSVERIWDDYFAGCDKLSVIYTKKGCVAEKWAIQNGYTVKYLQEEKTQPSPKGTKLTVSSTKDIVKVTSADAKNPNVAYVKCARSNATTVKVPDTVTINGVTYKVTAIADKAFSGNSKLSKVTLGKNVTAIGKNAFKNCSKLKTVTIPSKSFQKIGAAAFSGCKNLTRITLKSTKLSKSSVGKSALKGTNKKLVIQVPKSKVKKYKSYFKNKGNAKVKVK